MGSIGNGVINTFTDGSVVSANGAGGAENALNPKMQIIQAAVDDNNSRIGVLEGQVSALGGLVYNVVTYGADPSGVNDSTTAIQNAIDDAVANQGIVVFSNGLYKITDELTVGGTCYITSDGSGQGVVIFQTTSSKSIFNITASYVRITDLKLDIRSTSVGATYTITAQHPTLSSLVSIFVQRCQFYSTPSTAINAISFTKVASGGISNCSISGNSTSNGVKLIDCSNVLISQNYFTGVSQALLVNYGSVADVTANNNLIIEQNSVSGITTNAFSINYATNTRVVENVFAQITGTSTTYAFIVVSNCVYLSVNNNKFDHQLSATTYYHRGVSVSDTLYPTISNNSFNYGGNALHAPSNVSYLQFSDNVVLEPNLYAINSSTALKSALIADNTFIDVWSNLLTPAAIYITAGTRISIIGNTLVRGSKSAAFINAYGVNFPAGPIPVLMSGNDFTIATTPISVTGNTAYEVDPVGVKIYYGTAAPTVGTYVRGTKVMNTTPSAGGYIGWVCTTAGTPGTWKGFGTIQV